jgi:hypothetical protein
LAEDYIYVTLAIQVMHLQRQALVLRLLLALKLTKQNGIFMQPVLTGKATGQLLLDIKLTM